MMRNLRRLELAVGFVAVSASLTAMSYATDVTGHGTSQEGDNPPFAFTLKSGGNALTGTMGSMDGKELPISDGKLDGTLSPFR